MRDEDGVREVFSAPVFSAPESVLSFIDFGVTFRATIYLSIGDEPGFIEADVTLGYGELPTKARVDAIVWRTIDEVAQRKGVDPSLVRLRAPRDTCFPIEWPVSGYQLGERTEDPTASDTFDAERMVEALARAKAALVEEESR